MSLQFTDLLTGTGAFAFLASYSGEAQYRWCTVFLCTARWAGASDTKETISASLFTIPFQTVAVVVERSSNAALAILFFFNAAHKYILMGVA